MYDLDFKSLRKRISPEINFTPMIDLVFNLLIFVIASTTFLSNSGLNLNLVKGKNIEQVPAGVEIIVHKEGTIYYKENGKETQLNSARDLIGFVNRSVTSNPKTPFVVKADRDTSYQVVVDVLDAVKDGGSDHVSLGMEPRREQRDEKPK